MARIFWIKMSINNIQLNDDEPVTTSELVLPESPIVAFGDPVRKLYIFRNQICIAYVPKKGKCIGSKRQEKIPRYLCRIRKFYF